MKKKLLKLAKFTFEFLFLLNGKKRTINWNGHKIKFYLSSMSTYSRSKTCVWGEPITIKWIDGFKNGEIFYDIGANVGIFSLYAAKKGCKVFAFEPTFHSYYVLNQNIILNNLDIKAFCIALDKEFCVNNMYLVNLEDSQTRAYFNDDVENTKYIQGIVAMNVDKLTKMLLFPTHIKIDIDGNEKNVIEGMKNTLKDKRLKSVLIEIKGDHKPIRNLMAKGGFNYFEKQILNKKHNISNYVFRRKENV